MIRYLGIDRLAVIDTLEVEFRPGLNVLTGETGAGKSIVVGAIGLLSGARAYPDLVRTGEETAQVQAIFESPDGSEITIRRELSRQGRSRAFVDGVLASTARLREITRELVDLHGQHDHQLLLEPRYQLGLLDAFADILDQRRATGEAFQKWKGSQVELEQVEADACTTVERRDFLRFQLAEIDAASPRDGEDVGLEAARGRLANAERLHQLCTDTYQRLYEGDAAILSELGVVWRSLGELAALDPVFEDHVSAHAEVDTRLEDLAFDLRSYAANLEVSPAKLEEAEARLATLERLKKKHGGELSAVLARQESIRSELHSLEQSSVRVEGLARRVADLRAQYLDHAERLSQARRAAAPRLDRRLEQLLAELAMPGARCEFSFEETIAESGWQASGIDAGELHLSANIGESVKPLAKVASGGELSRIMLGLKTLATTDEPGRTLVFDEVDAGIGGEVAHVVGHRLQELGERFQLLCITHLPQIASVADTQFHVAKSVQAGRTVTSVRCLSEDERALEIGRMIGGERSSREILASARAMIERDARPGRQTAKAKGERAKAKGGER